MVLLREIHGRWFFLVYRGGTEVPIAQSPPVLEPHAPSLSLRIPPHSLPAARTAGCSSRLRLGGAATILKPDARARGLHHLCTELLVYLVQFEALLQPAVLLQFAALLHFVPSSKLLCPLGPNH